MSALAFVGGWLVLALGTHYVICRLPEERSRFDDDPLALLAACVFAWYMVWAFAILWALGRLGSWYVELVRPSPPDPVALEAQRELDTYLGEDVALSPRKE